MVIPLEDVSYFREETIAAFTDFYKFLQMLYIRDSDIIYPPPEGWPSIVNASPEILEAFGKSDGVSLLAHLPYIRASNAGYDCGPDVFPNRHLTNWQDEFEGFNTSFPIKGRASIDLVRDWGEGPLFPLNLPNVVSIASGTFVPMPEIIMDVERGIICWGEETCPLRLQTDYPEFWVEREEEECSCCEDSEEDEGGDEDGHREDEKECEHPVGVYWEFRECGGLWRIPDFFEVLMIQFLELNWVPCSHWLVNDSEDSELPQEKGLVAMVQGIFRQHGWPDELDRYDRDTCIGAVRRACKENYPDNLDVNAHHYEVSQARLVDGKDGDGV